MGPSTGAGAPLRTGREALTRVQHAGQPHEGKALLEADEIVFRPAERGGLRLKIPLKGITSVNADDGRLTVQWPEGETVFELGAEAEKWAERIRNPKSLLDKLGVKAGMRIAVIGVDDAGFLADLGERTEPTGEAQDADIVFIAANRPADVPRLPHLKKQIKRDGAVWVVYRKGQREFGENDVLRLGLESGLVDVKVVRFSETHTATKFVIRKAER